MARPMMMSTEDYGGGGGYGGGSYGGGGGGVGLRPIPRTVSRTPTVSTPFPPSPTRGGSYAPQPFTGSRPRGQAQGTNYFPIGSQTLDQPMFPWLMPYQGQFTEPMSPYEMQGLGGISEFVGGGMGLGQSEDYLSDVIGGNYLDPRTNRWLAGIQSGAQSLKDIEDAQARRRIGSAMAAGGNALSGARLGAEQDYQNESDARFQEMISRLMSENYQRERGLQSGAINQRMGLSDQLLGGRERLMAAGAVPRQIGQAERNAQYGDWLRQIGGMEEAYRYPDQLAQSTLARGYPGSYQPQFGESAFGGLLGLLSPLLGQLLGGRNQQQQRPSGGSTGGGPGGGGATQPGQRPGQQGEQQGGGYPGSVYNEPIGPNPDWGYWGDPFANEGSMYGSTWGDIWNSPDYTGYEDYYNQNPNDFWGNTTIGDTGWVGGNEFDNYGGYNMDWGDVFGGGGGGDNYSDWGGMDMGGFDWGL